MKKVFPNSLLLEDMDLDVDIEDLIEIFNTQKKRGLTENELNKILSIVDNIPTLEQFITNNIGKSIYEVNGLKASQNLLFDMLWGKWINKETILPSLTPALSETNEIKLLAKRLRLLSQGNNEKIIDITNEELEKLDDIKPKYKNFEVASLPLQQKLRNGFLATKGIGIGATAIVSSFKQFAEQIGLVYSGEKQISLGNKVLGMDDFGKQNDKEGNSIQSQISATLSELLDIVKNPDAIDLNITKYNVGIIGMALTIGAGEDIYYFITQPILKKLSTNLNNKIGQVQGKAWRIEKKLRQEYLTKLEQIKGKKVNIKSLPMIYTKEELKQNIFDSKRAVMVYNQIIQKIPTILEDKTFLEDYLIKQIHILDKYLELKKISRKYTEVILSSRIDTSKFGNSISDITLFNNKLKKMIDTTEFVTVTDEGVDTIDALLDNTFLGDLKKNGVDLAINIFNNLSIKSSPAFLTLVNKILIDTNNNDYWSYEDQRSINKRISDIVMGVIKYKYFTDNEIITKESIQELIYGETALVKSLKKIKNKNKNSLLFKYLLGKSSVTGPNLITAPALNLKPKERSRMIQEIKDSIADEKWGYDKIILYAIISSGFNKKMYTFNDLIPISRLIDYGMNNYMNKILMESNNPNLLLDLQDEIYKNNWMNDELVPEVTEIIESARLIKGGPITIFSTTEGYVGQNELGEHIYTPYVKIREIDTINLYKFVGNIKVSKSTEDNVYKGVYKIVSKKGYYEAGSYIYEYFTSESVFKENNIVEFDTNKIKLIQLEDIETGKKSIPFQKFKLISNTNIINIISEEEQLDESIKNEQSSDILPITISDDILTDSRENLEENKYNIDNKEIIVDESLSGTINDLLQNGKLQEWWSRNGWSEKIGVVNYIKSLKDTMTIDSSKRYLKTKYGKQINNLPMDIKTNELLKSNGIVNLNLTSNIENLSNEVKVKDNIGISDLLNKKNIISDQAAKDKLNNC
ncbi:hypothetical protein CCP3SC1AL1_2060001 [Gammaproteobacteria bacterium]